MRKQIETEGEQTVGQNQKNTQEPDMNQLRKVRREKLAELQQNGRDPFQITKFNQTHHTSCDCYVDRACIHDASSLFVIILESLFCLLFIHTFYVRLLVIF